MDCRFVVILIFRQTIKLILREILFSLNLRLYRAYDRFYGSVDRKTVQKDMTFQTVDIPKLLGNAGFRVQVEN